MNQPPGWVSSTFVQRVHKAMQRSFEYTDLLEIARRKVSTNWLALKANLPVEHMWVMWAIGRRKLALPIHRMVTTQLTTVRRSKGFTLTPIENWPSKTLVKYRLRE